MKPNLQLTKRIWKPKFLKWNLGIQDPHLNNSSISSWYKELKNDFGGIFLFGGQTFFSSSSHLQNSPPKAKNLKNKIPVDFSSWKNHFYCSFPTLLWRIDKKKHTQEIHMNSVHDLVLFFEKGNLNRALIKLRIFFKYIFF